ncbi:MAG: Unknown protein, partial [uncultured Thiotrichaceae bacterium]
MPNHNMLIPNLMVENVQKTMRFYHDVLGFELMAAVVDMQAGMDETNIILDVNDEHSLDWVNMKRGEIELMFQSRASLSTEVPELAEVAIGASQTLYLRCEGLQSLYKKVKGSVDIIKEPHNKFYGMREFYVKDINGYILCFAEEI